MGYTHYFDHPQLDDVTFKAFANDCSLILAWLPKTTPTAGGYYTHEPLEVCFDYDRPELGPEVSHKRVRFNGKGELGHETFYMDQACEDGFCKTARKPYDVAVVACLTALKFHAPSTKLTSDGTLDERADGIALFCEATGRAPVLWDKDL